MITVHLTSFLEAWESDGLGPLLKDHLPGGPPNVRRLTLIELIKVDLEFRYGGDLPRLLLEDYAAECPELIHPDGMPAELIYEEYHVRLASGESVKASDCFERFPERHAELGRLFQLDATETGSGSASGKQLSEQFHEGEHIGDFYLMSQLGTGAFGSVFLARQESMQRTVALKISSDHGQEGQTLAQLDHPNIVRVHDQVRLEEQNLRLLYMQFCAGGTLQAVVRESRTHNGSRSGQLMIDCISAAIERTGVLSPDALPVGSELSTLPWEQVTCRVGAELADALQYAHGRGILHRDIKPANVLLDINGAARLADFNISFNAELDGSSPAAYFGGSLAYMSPEQLEAFDPAHPRTPPEIDARADVYSLGVLLWELLFGQRPFPENINGGSADILTEMVRIRRTASVRPLEDVDSPVHQQLVHILRRCLNEDPEKRYQTAGELAAELRLCRQPRVAEIVYRSQTGWRQLAASWPVLFLVLTAVGPHVPAAAFNAVYNDQNIIGALSSDQARQGFITMVAIINLVAFSAGIAITIGYFGPVRRTLQKVPSADDEPALARVLQVSRFVTLVGIVEWIIAGIAYPVTLHFIMDDGLQIKWHAHFFISLFICGLVAAAYPFFLTSKLSIRALLPRVLRGTRVSANTLERLRQLGSQSIWSLYLAGGVPAAGIIILLTTQETADARFPLQVFSLLGAVGYGFTLTLARSLQNDIEALQSVLQTKN